MIVPTNRLQLASIVICSLGIAQTAFAHISVDQGGTHLSRYSDSSLKENPCGIADGARGTNVYTYKPGETIIVSIKETVSHPSYFRIAFDVDGDDDFLTPSGTAGEFGNCAGDPACGLGKEDYCNNDAVLLDHLDAHASAFGTTPIHTWSVTLPNVECANCTLQIIQVMNDLNVHTAPYPQDDVYYQCIDLVLSNSAADVTDAPLANDGMVCASTTIPSGDAGTAGVMPTGGSIATGGSSIMSGGGSGAEVDASIPGASGGIALGGGVPGMDPLGAGMTTIPPAGTGGAGVGSSAGTTEPSANSSSCGCSTLGARTMTHSNLGIVVLGLGVLAFRKRRKFNQSRCRLANS